MVLSSSGILSRLAKGGLVVNPIDDVGMQVQPASIDPHLDTEFLGFQRTNTSRIHPNREDEMSEYVRKAYVPEGGDFALHPDDFVPETTKEYVEIPTNLLATVEGRPSLGHPAVVTHVTADIVDPGYGGQIILGLPNLGTAPVALTPGMRILQLVFTETKSPVDHPYGVERGSECQGQRGPWASWLSSNPGFGGDE